MAETVVERKLAAILAADVVGYSGLCKRTNEARTRKYMAPRKQLIASKIIELES